MCTISPLSRAGYNSCLPIVSWFSEKIQRIQEYATRFFHWVFEQNFRFWDWLLSACGCNATDLSQGQRLEVDCENFSTALEVLGLSEQEAQNRDTVELRYQALSREWDKRIQASSISPPLLQRFQILKEKADRSYATIMRHLEPVQPES